ncbi:MAG TPA: ATPase, partial [Cellulomonas sp.]|nr:ATPase [Cellulomonas sp.]
MAEELVSPIRQGAHDIALDRERMRRRRVYRFAIPVLLIEAYVIGAAFAGWSIVPPLPHVDPFLLT